MKKVIFFSAIALYIGFTAGYYMGLQQAPPPQSAAKTVISPRPPAAVAGAQTDIVARVIDGDTVELASGQTVRYIGIDTPRDPRPEKK